MATLKHPEVSAEKSRRLTEERVLKNPPGDTDVRQYELNALAIGAGVSEDEMFLREVAQLAGLLFDAKSGEAENFEQRGNEVLSLMKQSHDDPLSPMSDIGYQGANRELLFAMFWAYKRRFLPSGDHVLKRIAPWDQEVYEQHHQVIDASFQTLLAALDEELANLRIDAVRSEHHPAVRLEHAASQLHKLASLAQRSATKIYLDTGAGTGGRPRSKMNASRERDLEATVEIKFLKVSPLKIVCLEDFKQKDGNDQWRSGAAKNASTAASKTLTRMNKCAVEWFAQFKKERAVIWDQLDSQNGVQNS